MDNIYATDDKTTDGWDDDDLDLIDEWEIDDAPDDGCATATGTANEESSSSYPPSSIQGYFQYLKTGVKPNTPISLTTTAEALRTYYESRPNLKTYTLEKEVHRMDYVVIQSDGTVLEGPDAIRNVFCSQNINGSDSPSSSDKEDTEMKTSAKSITNEDFLWRASNQSILADVLASMMDVNGLVRPQFMATAVARSVSFRVDFARGCTDCTASFAIMIPFEKDGDASMLELATTEIQLTYSIDALSCTILQLQTNPSLDASKDLEIAAQQYAADDSFGILTTPEEAVDRSFLNDQQRDAFIVEGIGGAWKQLDETTGISNKIGAVSTYFTTDLKNCLEDYEQEVLEEEMGAGTVNVAAGSAVQRPGSLLGGMLGGLAKVALSAAQGADESHHEPVQFYRKEAMGLPNNNKRAEPKTQNIVQEMYHDTSRQNLSTTEGWSDEELDFDSNFSADKISIEAKQRTIKLQNGIEGGDCNTNALKDENEGHDERILTRKRWIRPHYTEYVFAH